MVLRMCPNINIKNTKKMKHIIIAILLAFTVNAQVNYYNTTINGTYSSAIGLNNEVDGVNALPL